MAEQPEIPGAGAYAEQLSEANQFLMGGGRRSSPSSSTPEMTGKALEIASRLREIFYAYTAREERSQQTHLGPSEIGTPCERRIAMRLLGLPKVNPGGDRWASWKGTQVHRGLAEMLDWANAGTGRFATEVRVGLPSPNVPFGTTDALDRTMFLLIDHKCLGSTSLSNFRTNGPPPKYRVQGHVYGLGASEQGERIEDIAIVVWPIEAATLRGLWVWTEPYDESIAREALARVDRIKGILDQMPKDDKYRAQNFPIADDCKFCEFHHATKGCPGQ